MKLVLILLITSTAIELIAYVKPFWKHRSMLGGLAFSGTLAGTALLVQDKSLLLGASLGLICLYRLFNHFRLISGLVSPQRLRNTAFKSSIHLGIIFYLLLAASEYLSLHIKTQDIFLSISLLMLALAIFCAQALRLSLKRMALPKEFEPMTSQDLPTITIAIPARNETTDFEDCLKSLTHSSYPKVEIIILDDCSQNRRTPDIIRQFAHDGVRFLSGDVPPAPWLAKNYAYQQLLKQANGEYIMFCGVDTRFEPDAIARIVETLIQSQKSMISLMPINRVSSGKILPYLIQPVRYAWEIALPRRWKSRPPVLSTCWIAKTEFLRSKGGFAAVMQAILPERYFAKEALKETSYAFYRADKTVGLYCIKSGPQQQETAIRTRYPILQRSPETVLYLSLLELGLIISPILLIIHSINNSHPELIIINLLTILVLSVIYGSIDKITYEKWKIFGFIAMPFALVYDVIILHISMCKYEFSEVLWKGRNICLPELQAYPRLPLERDDR